jgi:hypothetical protein
LEIDGFPHTLSAIYRRDTLPHKLRTLRNLNTPEDYLAALANAGLTVPP